MTASNSTPDRFLEDFAPGDIWSSEEFVVTAEDIKQFGRAYDPQPFHTDEELAQRGPFGGLVASGWHLAALAMRVFASSRPFGNTPIVGLGVDELRWLSPVRAGHRLTVRREILSAQRSKSKPDRGVLRSQLTMSDQDGTPVMRLIALTQLPARNAVPATD